MYKRVNCGSRSTCNAFWFLQTESIPRRKTMSNFSILFWELLGKWVNYIFNNMLATWEFGTKKTIKRKFCTAHRWSTNTFFRNILRWSTKSFLQIRDSEHMNSGPVKDDQEMSFGPIIDGQQRFLVQSQTVYKEYCINWIYRQSTHRN